VFGVDGFNAEMIDTMQGYWISFARTGVPGSGTTLAPWPAFTSSSEKNMRLDTGSNLGAVDGWWEGKHCDFWKTNLP